MFQDMMRMYLERWECFLLEEGAYSKQLQAPDGKAAVSSTYLRTYLIIDSCREISFQDSIHILVRKNDSTFVLCALLMYAVFLASNQQDLVTGTQSILSMKRRENLYDDQGNCSY